MATTDLLSGLKCNSGFFFSLPAVRIEMPGNSLTELVMHLLCSKINELVRLSTTTVGIRRALSEIHIIIRCFGTYDVLACAFLNC
jgi:hypothetical protein